MSQNHRLLKLFLLSLIIHLGILPLFSLILPPGRKKRAAIEVSLRQWQISPRKEISLVRMKVIPELPRFRADEQIFLRTEQAIGLRMTKESLGTQPRAMLTATRPLPVPEFNVQYPRLSSRPVEETIPLSPGTISEEITGPGGQRKLVYRHPFTYPDWAQKKGLEGNIRLRFWLLPDGRVDQTELLVSSGWPELDILVEDAFRKWLFESVAEDRKVWGEIVFRLRLK
ncbi:MAG: energy transducer TonB [Candidatus Omnitrophica bacterium]|nr:energy transducer TonB [Candidatus Omnitrophota bacterium]